MHAAHFSFLYGTFTARKKLKRNFEGIGTYVVLYEEMRECLVIFLLYTVFSNLFSHMEAVFLIHEFAPNPFYFPLFF